MSRFIIGIILLCLSFSANAGFFQEPDKQAHITWSAGGAMWMLIMSDGELTPTQAFGAMMAVGVAKEIYDGKNNTMKEHLRDLTADAIGASIVFTISWD